ncbi:hypothetical protein CBL_01711 [Carabus blaptoides fortunei]
MNGNNRTMNQRQTKRSTTENTEQFSQWSIQTNTNIHTKGVTLPLVNTMQTAERIGPTACLDCVPTYQVLTTDTRKTSPMRLILRVPVSVIPPLAHSRRHPRIVYHPPRAHLCKLAEERVSHTSRARRGMQLTKLSYAVSTSI